MKKNFFTPVRICNLVCLALLLALFVLQFMPYWATSEEVVSLAEYVWNPREHRDLTKIFNTYNYDINSMVTAPVVTLFALGFFFAFSFKLSNKSGLSLISLVSGIITINGFLNNVVLQLNPMWVVHLVLAIIMVVVSVVCFFWPIVTKLSIYAKEAKAAKAAQAQ